jgi:hypothetical protein
MVTKAKKSPMDLRAPRKRSVSLTFSHDTSHRVRVLTQRASTQIGQLRQLMPLYQRTERILMPEGLKRMRDTSGIPAAQLEAGAMLYALNHELVLFMNGLTDTVAALQAYVEDASGSDD